MAYPQIDVNDLARKMSEQWRIEAEREQQQRRLQNNIALAQAIQGMDSKQALAFAVGELLRGAWNSWKDNYDARGEQKNIDRANAIKNITKSSGLPEAVVGRLYDALSNPKTQEILKQTGAMMDDAKRNMPQINQDTTQRLAPIAAGTPPVDWQNPNQQPDVPAWYNRGQRAADVVLPIPQGLLGNDNQLTRAANAPTLQDALINAPPEEREELLRRLGYGR